MQSEILHIENISKRYGLVEALNNLSLTIKQGQVFGILGPNGSGKTTTLSIVMGIISADAGNYSWFEQANSNEYHKKIGSLIETPNFYPYLTAWQNLSITAKIKEIDVADIERVLKVTGLFERRNYRFDTFSLGMKQRLALSSVLLGDPQVLVLDEPANGLDPQGIADIREIIRTQAALGKTIILASHILDEVEKVCTHAAVLKKGKLIASGKVNELLSAKEQLFLSSDRNPDLFEFLVRAGVCNNVTMVEKGILIEVQQPYGSAHINKLAFENGFMLNVIEPRNQSLEEQFLELIKK
jgi:ABC-type multidrug transport system ATPase subunit